MHMMQALSKSAFWVVYIYVQLGGGFVRIFFNFTSAPNIAFMTSQYDVCIYIMNMFMLVSVSVTSIYSA